MDLPRHIRVLIVDDSLVAREMLAQILSSDPDIEIVGMAHDGAEGVEMVERLRPDLVTMDIHMPKMDGLAATERIMAYTPTPILVVSSSVHGEGVGRAFDALSAGALEVVKKPEPRDWAELDSIGRAMIRRVRVLSRVKVITHIRGKRDQLVGGARSAAAGPPISSRSLVAIGSSTGGPSALLSVLGRLRPGFPLPIVIAQHIADGFVPGLVSWLDGNCAIKIVQAVDGEELAAGRAYVAPTGMNTEVSGDRVHFTKPKKDQLYIPSANTLFESVARSCHERGVGVLLTGMGADGAVGLKALFDAGGFTIAQDEETSIVFGMPKAAIEAGAARKVLGVQDIGAELERLAGLV
ncbi:MAG: chemotaxis-specific protein-glutamate methyltransferase CheB [Coriobacteriia bacterium]|nr:chemotaxis-specific protein-glutamate methyltransferase CheB [Coriobacteriia bacterium]